MENRNIRSDKRRRALALGLALGLIAGMVLVAACGDKKKSVQTGERAYSNDLDLGNVSLAMKDLSGIPVRLEGGKFEGDHLTVKLVKEAEADLDGDGLTDAAAVILEDSGGSGNFRSLCMFLNNGKELVHVDTAEIGDRVQVRDLKIEKGVVTVTYLDRLPGKSFADPLTSKKVIRFEVRGRKLIQLRENSE